MQIFFPASGKKKKKELQLHGKKETDFVIC